MRRWRGRRKRFQSTLPARGATRDTCGERCDSIISIHAPRTGSDIVSLRDSSLGKVISIHAPRTGSDSCFPICWNCFRTFQSTLPARGATIREGHHRRAPCLFQSTLPARGATVLLLRMNPARNDFNPRSPHGERLQAGSSLPTWQYFNPRSPHGERRAYRRLVRRCRTYFNPRSPHGERLVLSTSAQKPSQFQSTLPARGAT